MRSLHPPIYERGWKQGQGYQPRGMPRHRKDAEGESAKFPWYPPTIDPRNVTLRDMAVNQTTEDGPTLQDIELEETDQPRAETKLSEVEVNSVSSEEVCACWWESGRRPKRKMSRALTVVSTVHLPVCPPLGLEEQTDDATFGGRQGWDPVHVISGLLSLQIGRFGPNKCGKVLEAEVDQIYTLCPITLGKIDYLTGEPLSRRLAASYRGKRKADVLRDELARYDVSRYAYDGGFRYRQNEIPDKDEDFPSDSSMFICGSWNGFTMEDMFSSIIVLGPERYDLFELYIDKNQEYCFFPAADRAGQVIAVEGPAENKERKRSLPFSFAAAMARKKSRSSSSSRGKKRSRSKEKDNSSSESSSSGSEDMGRRVWPIAVGLATSSFQLLPPMLELVDVTTDPPPELQLPTPAPVTLAVPAPAPPAGFTSGFADKLRPGLGITPTASTLARHAPLTGQALAQQQGKQQVCFNYTGGKCFRADCRFLHLGPGPRRLRRVFSSEVQTTEALIACNRTLILVQAMQCADDSQLQEWSTTFRIGQRGREEFQILRDGDRLQAIYPTFPHATGAGEEA
eukprot:g1995.t1